MKTISCLIEFNEVCKTAAQHAVWLAKKHNATIELLYFDSKSRDKEDLRKRVLELTNIEAEDVDFMCSVITGNAIKLIAKTVNKLSSEYFVIGAYGKESMSDLWTAKNVVNLAQQIKIPTLVVNEFTKNAKPNIKNILFPIAPHPNFNIQFEEAGTWAKENGAKIEIFCLVSEGNDMPEDIAKNLSDSQLYFEKEGIPCSKVIRETEVYSVGYAKDIIKHTEETQFDLMTIMSMNSDENMYFGDFEKITLFQNTKGIPVLCVND